jgi:hypothetical protein
VMSTVVLYLKNGKKNNFIIRSEILWMRRKFLMKW